MSAKDNNVIKYNHGENSIKLPFVVYADLECLLEKMSTCSNNPKESSTAKINKHTPSGYSIFTHCSFDKSKSKLNYHRGEGLPSSIADDELENTICRVLQHIGANITNEKIESCHQLSKNADMTIVKFLRRKDCEQVMRVKSELKS